MYLCTQSCMFIIISTDTLVDSWPLPSQFLHKTGLPQLKQQLPAQPYCYGGVSPQLPQPPTGWPPSSASPSLTSTTCRSPSTTWRSLSRGWKEGGWKGRCPQEKGKGTQVNLGISSVSSLASTAAGPRSHPPAWHKLSPWEVWGKFTPSKQGNTLKVVLLYCQGLYSKEAATSLAFLCEATVNLY